MLDLFNALAIRLRWLRPVSVLVVVGCSGLFGYAVLAENAPDRFITTGLIGVCWGLLLFVFLSFFQCLPDMPSPEHSWWQRVRLRLRRWGYGFLGIATIGLTIGVIVGTVRLT